MLSTKLAGALVALAFGLLAVTAQEAAAAAYTVTNANSSGAGSLRNRIIAANNNMGVVDTIEFDFPGATPQTITPINLVHVESGTDNEVMSDDNTIGGPDAGEGNVVSGNQREGIEFRADPVTNDPSEGNTVAGNLIGVGLSRARLAATGRRIGSSAPEADPPAVVAAASADRGRYVRPRAAQPTVRDPQDL